MANQEYLDLLKQGSSVWNPWRKQHKEVQPDLSGADLSYSGLFKDYFSVVDLSRANLDEANLRGVDFSAANLSEASLNNTDLRGAYLYGADLSNASLIGANLSGADLNNTDLKRAKLIGADLTNADLLNADLSNADLSNARLIRTRLIGTNLTAANLTHCSVYGVAAWDVRLQGTTQDSLVITLPNQPIITVDNLKIAQFIYLLLNNEEIRDVINTLTTKAVLILGRFTPERKAVLDALRDALRKHNYLPILFDFDPAKNQTVRETVRTLAHLSHFIIADLTNPSSIPEELETIVPTLAVPVQPLLELTQKREFSMFKGYGVYPWVLPIYHYSDLEGLVNNLQEKVIDPATQKARELANKKVHLNQKPFEQTT